MKQVFLSASWSRKYEVRRLAAELEHENVHVQASWLYQPDGKGDKHRREMGYQDIRDVHECDVYVRLSDDLEEIATHLPNVQHGDLVTPLVPMHLATGARMFEMGLAYGLGKEIYVVGGHQMIFDYMPRVQHVKSKEELVLALCPTVQ